MTFCCLWEKRRDQKGLSFIAPHTQKESYSIHQRDVATVACLPGKRLPDMDKPIISAGQIEEFRRAILILFHPFRSFGNFNIACGDSTSKIFQLWWQELAPEPARKFLYYSNDYYMSRELARQRIYDDTERYFACLGVHQVPVEEVDRCIAEAEQVLKLREQSTTTEAQNHRDDTVFPTQVSLLSDALASADIWIGSCFPTAPPMCCRYVKYITCGDIAAFEPE
ncbi:hypothetical protein JG687_00008750 [Phytophthora cactorum]|uniref:Uncharacterized protein n=1 Tax=Phytophthora cactorum TaxID=29920 RepID=A0A8T1UBW0_9STRA|nr:hypothetical protein GQ600_7385 [Phytophthora cactorum]KAG6959527.1 hypothetical protein JG687_00008750 [Phytophthora cactorum]